MMQYVNQGGQLSEPILKHKAKDLDESLKIEDFRCSEGWLDKFKKRHGLSLRRKEGEAAAADQAGISLALQSVPLIIEECSFAPADI